MTIEDIEQLLPNGFHDSYITALHVNYAQRTVEMDMNIWVSNLETGGGPDEYQPLKLSLSGLIYFVIEPPGDLYLDTSKPWLVAGGSSEVATSPSQLPKSLPAGAFTYWFFVNNWNSYIHIAALTANFETTPDTILNEN
jgi:hypothetical protein